MAVQSATGVSVAQTELKAGALKLPSIFMQSLTMVAPGIAALFYTPVVVDQAGLAAPLAYPIAFVIVLLHRDRARPAGPGRPVGRWLLHLRLPRASTRGSASSSRGSTSSTRRSSWAR